MVFEGSSRNPGVMVHSWEFKSYNWHILKTTTCTRYGWIGLRLKWRNGGEDKSYLSVANKIIKRYCCKLSATKLRNGRDYKIRNNNLPLSCSPVFVGNPQGMMQRTSSNSRQYYIEICKANLLCLGTLLDEGQRQSKQTRCIPRHGWYSSNVAASYGNQCRLPYSPALPLVQAGLFWCDKSHYLLC